MITDGKRRKNKDTSSDSDSSKRYKNGLNYVTTSGAGTDTTINAINAGNPTTTTYTTVAAHSPSSSILPMASNFSVPTISSTNVSSDDHNGEQLFTTPLSLQSSSSSSSSSTDLNASPTLYPVFESSVPPVSESIHTSTPITMSSLSSVSSNTSNNTSLEPINGINKPSTESKNRCYQVTQMTSVNIHPIYNQTQAFSNSYGFASPYQQQYLQQQQPQQPQQYQTRPMSGMSTARSRSRTNKSGFNHSQVVNALNQGLMHGKGNQKTQPTQKFGGGNFPQTLPVVITPPVVVMPGKIQGLYVVFFIINLCV